MRACLTALLLLALPGCTEPKELAGTWEGTITTVGTRLEYTYSPITGGSVNPVPDVRIGPSPFGPLILDNDGSYTMPGLDFSGEWSVEGEGIVLTGDLGGAAAWVERLQSGPVVVIEVPLGDGQVQRVNFSRAP